MPLAYSWVRTCLRSGTCTTVTKTCFKLAADGVDRWERKKLLGCDSSTADAVVTSDMVRVIKGLGFMVKPIACSSLAQVRYKVSTMSQHVMSSKLCTKSIWRALFRVPGGTGCNVMQILSILESWKSLDTHRADRAAAIIIDYY